MTESQSDDIACPSCRSRQTRPAWVYETFRIRHCASCDLEFVSPIRGQSATFEYYKENYVPRILDLASEKGFIFVSAYLRAPIEKYLPPERRKLALDIGCGPGYLLTALKAWGF